MKWRDSSETRFGKSLVEGLRSACVLCRVPCIGILNNLVKTATMDLQVAQYTNTITSDTGTDLHASKTAHGASIESDIATTLETRAKEKKTTLRTKTADASITTTSHVITLR